MSQQCVLGIQIFNHSTGCIIKNVASSIKEVIFPLYSCDTSPLDLHSALKKDVGLLERVQRTTMEIEYWNTSPIKKV